MIRIKRKGKAPKILLETGKIRTLSDIADLASSRNGTPIILFASSIYGAKTVKNRLIKIQAGKCCFCESKITHVSYGDVEHFRPKAAFRQGSRDPLTRPGYFWLAYAWSNLLLCCQLCNQRHKGNSFPLIDPSCRVRRHTDDLSVEKPVFIDPAAENPEEFIGFRGGTPFSIDGNIRGTETIERLGLDRKELRYRREALLEQLRILYKLAYDTSDNLLQQEARELQTQARELLAEAASASAEYSSAVKAAMADGFKYV